MIVYLGLRASNKLNKRVSELRLTLIMIDKIKTLLTYSGCTTDDIIKQLRCDDELHNLVFIEKCSELIRSSNTSVAWRTSIEDTATKSSLSLQDRAHLISIGSILGAYDAKTQIAKLDLITEFIKKNLENATVKAKDNAKLYRTLGVLCGIGTVIMFM